MSNIGTSRAYRAIAVVILSGLLAVTLYVLYQAPRFGDGLDGTPSWMGRQEKRLLLGLFLVSVLLCWIGRSPATAILRRIVAPIRRLGSGLVVGFALLAFLAFGLVAGRVLDGFPNSGDEQALALQAQAYAQGQLWMEPPPLKEAFRMVHYRDIMDKWVSRYTPGWAAVAAPIAALDLPLWIVNPLVGALTLIAFFFLARTYVSRECAWIGVLLLGTSSFYILNSASYFSHILAALYGILFAIFGARYLAKGNAWYAIVAGAAIGLMGVTRTQNAAIFLIPLVVALVMTPGRRVGLIFLGFGGLPFLIAFLAYNYEITGHPLVTVQSLRDSPLGYPTSKTIDLTVERIAELMVWTAPLLIIGYILSFAIVLYRNRYDFTDWIMPLTITFFVFYDGAGGNQYGPRYYFEAWPFAILTTLKVLEPVLFGPEPKRYAAWIGSALVASLLVQLAYLPARFYREHAVVVARQAVHSAVERAALENAVVIIASRTGRDIRGMGSKDLLRNGHDLNTQNVIYALDLKQNNEKLKSLFPDRQFFVYRDGQLEAYP